MYLKKNLACKFWYLKSVKSKFFPDFAEFADGPSISLTFPDTLSFPEFIFDYLALIFKELFYSSRNFWRALLFNLVPLGTYLVSLRDNPPLAEREAKLNAIFI